VKEGADFQLLPTFVPPSAMRATLKFDYVTLSEQTLAVKVESRDGASQQFLVPSRGGALETFETRVDLPPSRLSQVIIQTNGKASVIGNGDPRTVTMRIGNLAIKPLLTASAQ